MKKLTKTELRFRLLTLFVFLAFTLICSLNAMAQGDPAVLGTYANPSTLNNGTAPLLEGFDHHAELRVRQDAGSR